MNTISQYIDKEMNCIKKKKNGYKYATSSYMNAIPQKLQFDHRNSIPKTIFKNYNQPFTE